MPAEVDSEFQAMNQYRDETYDRHETKYLQAGGVGQSQQQLVLEIYFICIPLQSEINVE